MLLRHYALAPTAALLPATPEGAPALLRCTHPLQQHRLPPAAAALIEALQGGPALEHVASGIAPEWVDYLERLRGQGALQARYALAPLHDAGAAQWPAVEVVIPVLNNPAGLARCLAALQTQSLPDGRPYPDLRVTVVDDGSTPPLAVPDGPDGSRRRLLRLEANAGPASARNLAWRTPWPEEPPEEAPPLLAFVDSDCVPGADWLAAGAMLLDDPLVHGAGTRTDALDTTRLLGRYEAQCSSLHLGPRSGPVGGSWGVAPYLPSCNLLLRRSALAAVGGFTDGLRFGEDVELCQRLRAAGLGLFYWAEAPVAHDHRTAWGAFMARRRAYGRTQSWLTAREPEPAFAPGEGAAVLRPFHAALVLGVLGVALRSSWLVLLALLPVLLEGLRVLWPRAFTPPWRLTARQRGAAAARRGAAGLMQAARHAVRQSLVWWLLLLLLWPALLPGALAVFALGAAGEGLARRVRWRDLPPWAFLPAFAADAVAYSLGRWEGALRRAPAELRDRDRRKPGGRAQSGPDGA